VKIFDFPLAMFRSLPQCPVVSRNNQPIKTMTTSFSRFPTAELPETTPDAIGFFEAIALAGVEGEFVRIPAAVQRRHFGGTPFGKLGVKVTGCVCTTLRSVAYGCDFDRQEAYWSIADKAWRSTYDDQLTATFPR
jgi:hypothetical protein